MQLLEVLRRLLRIRGGFGSGLAGGRSYTWRPRGLN